jgi:aminocarboxymuconate-semialdehyde decarboxylase
MPNLFASQPEGPAMNAEALDIVDFHNHHVPAVFQPTTALRAPPDQQARWAAINTLLADEDALVAASHAGDISARVVNIPTALIADEQGRVPSGTEQRINDLLAALVARQNGRVIGLASIDAYSGEAGGREVGRAVRDLGFRGIFVDSASGDDFIDAPIARPTLIAAAELEVPVFVHPINPPLARKLAPYGRVGTLYARGTSNAAALVALIEGGVFDALSGLKTVFTNLAIGGLLLSGAFAGPRPDGSDITSLLRRHVHIDTMGFNPILLRAAVALLGARNVLVGSDWPIVDTLPLRGRVERLLSDAGVAAEPDRLAIAGGNARRLLQA